MCDTYCVTQNGTMRTTT